MKNEFKQTYKNGQKIGILLMKNEAMKEFIAERNYKDDFSPQDAVKILDKAHKKALKEVV